PEQELKNQSPVDGKKPDLGQTRPESKIRTMKSDIAEYMKDGKTSLLGIMTKQVEAEPEVAGRRKAWMPSSKVMAASTAVLIFVAAGSWFLYRYFAPPGVQPAPEIQEEKIPPSPIAVEKTQALEFAGDIVAISGIPDITIGETITDSLDTPPLPLLSIEEPTVKMTFGVNTSVFAGKEGEFKTSRQIQERLLKAADDDVALKVENSGNGWVVSGRGELHLTILIERLRREGYEFQVSRPQVIEKIVDGNIKTPYEKVYIEVPEEFQGVVMQKMGLRHGALQDMNSMDGVVTMEFIITTKELFGYRSEFITDTKGMGIFNSNFLEFGPDIEKGFERDNGSLVVHENGITKLYALIGAQDRGTLFIGPGIQVYKGQVIGMNSRSEDISVNVCKEKSQTNHRSSGEGTAEHFNSPKLLSLEEAVEYINDEELVEITPKSIRIRKADLSA
ncbi:MAG: GTP-binding protein, partial [Microgenomates group bacterium Gr01-1014_93]